MALCMEAFTDTLPIVCNGFKGTVVYMYTIGNDPNATELLSEVFSYLVAIREEGGQNAPHKKSNNNK